MYSVHLVHANLCTEKHRLCLCETLIIIFAREFNECASVFCVFRSEINANLKILSQPASQPLSQLITFANTKQS